eukprot:sb/3469057/
MLTKYGIIFASLFVIGSSIMCEQCDEAYINYWNGSAEEQPFYSSCDGRKEVYCEESCAYGYYEFGISGNDPDLPMFMIESGMIRGCGSNLVENRFEEMPENRPNQEYEQGLTDYRSVHWIYCSCDWLFTCFGWFLQPLLTYPSMSARLFPVSLSLPSALSPYNSPRDQGTEGDNGESDNGDEHSLKFRRVGAHSGTHQSLQGLADCYRLLPQSPQSTVGYGMLDLIGNGEGASNGMEDGG